MTGARQIWRSLILRLVEDGDEQSGHETKHTWSCSVQLQVFMYHNSNSPASMCALAVLNFMRSSEGGGG